MSAPSANPGNPGPNARPATAAREPSANPGQDAARAALGFPWRATCSEALRPWVQPQHPCPNPWDLAQQAGILALDLELRQWSEDPEMRRHSAPLARVRETLQNHSESRLGMAWAARSRNLRALPAPSLPKAVERLLPPQAGQILAEAWTAYLQDLLQAEWDLVPQDPSQDWRLQALLPPFSDPPPATPSDPEVAPGPTVWLAWTSPEPGRVEPLLVVAERAPMAGESLELRHGGSGLLVVPTMVATALSLETPSTEPIIRALCHHGGMWEDVTPPPE